MFIASRAALDRAPAERDVFARHSESLRSSVTFGSAGAVINS
jgi:hypothetical protein